MEHEMIFIVLACLGAFFMAFNNGANDVANSFAPTVGSGAISLKQAILIAGILNFVGAVLLGSHVATTLIEGVIHPDMFSDDVEYVLAMFSVLLAAGCFVLASTLFQMPVSSTQAIVGSLTGVSIASAGWGSVNWVMMGTIVASWFVSVLMAGGLAFAVYMLISKTIIRAPSKGVPARLMRWLPVIISGTTAIVLYSLLECTRLHVMIGVAQWESLLIALLFAASLFVLSRHAVAEMIADLPDDPESAEPPFKKLQVATACYVAFGHGSNDVANSISPVLAIYLVASQGHLPDGAENAGVPMWILALGGAGIAVGVGLLGHRVMATLAKGITPLSNTRGFSVNFAAATTVVMASAMGLPVSSTHAATGAVMGVGLDKGIGNINLKLIGKIVLTWLITVPVAGVVTVVIYSLLKLVF